MKYSIAAMLGRALRPHARWPRLWREPVLRGAYDAIVIGGGGHGLATAYYLAKNHGMRRVAVLEKRWIGSGNSGRNTAIVRSNYLFPASIAFYDRSLTLYEGLTDALGFNILLSQRGVLTLAYSRSELNRMRRRVAVLRALGVDAELVDVAEIARRVPALRLQTPTRCVVGGFVQPRGGIARHDAVVWGYARAADELGVDIAQRAEVSAIEVRAGCARGVTLRDGRKLEARRVVIAAASGTAALVEPLGIRLPVVPMALQAMVSEPVARFLDVVIDGAVYVSQSDRGELVVGGNSDAFASFAQRGVATTASRNFAALLDVVPRLAELRWLRQWSGTVDYPKDHSPIIGATPIGGVFLSTAWGSYGFKAIPAAGECLAQTIVDGRAHRLIAPFSLDRFRTGRLVREAESSGMDLEGVLV